MQVVLHIPRCFWLLVYLANPQARTGLPTKTEILFQHCRRSGPGPLPSLHAWAPTRWLNLFTDFDGTDLMRPGGTWRWSAGLSLLSEDRGVAAEPGPRDLCGGDAGESACRAGCCCLQHRLRSVLRTGACFVQRDHHVTSTA